MEITLVVGAMVGGGVAGLIAGLVLVRARFATASGASRILVLGPGFVATALAIFAAEHFFAARDLMQIVPLWLPVPLFWTYFVGAALLAAPIHTARLQICLGCWGESCSLRVMRGPCELF